MQSIIYFSCLSFHRPVSTDSSSVPPPFSSRVQMEAAWRAQSQGSLSSAGLLMQLFSSLCLPDTIFGPPSHTPLSGNVLSCGDCRAKFIKMEFGRLLHKIASIYICCLSLSMLYVFYHLILPLPVHANFQWAAVVNPG